MAKRPEYPKDVVKRTFLESGADAARKMADKIAAAGQMPGAARTPGQVERWIKEWEGGGVAPSSEKPATEARKAASKDKIADRASKRRLSNKEIEEIVNGLKKPGRRRVYDIGEPNVHGTILTEGEQVSVVRWDAPIPWGKETNTPNDKLKNVESEPTEHDRRVFMNAADFSVVRPNGLVKKGPKGKYSRADETISIHKTFAKAAEATGQDDGLWVFARTKGGGVALLMRPHWGKYLKLAETL